MAVKHIKEYYGIVQKQYRQMQENLKLFEEESQNGMVDPERVANIIKSIEPLKNNYQQLSYIMYLLNLPERKRKEARYITENKKLLEQIAKENTATAQIERNKAIVEGIH